MHGNKKRKKSFLALKEFISNTVYMVSSQHIRSIGAVDCVAYPTSRRRTVKAGGVSVVTESDYGEHFTQEYKPRDSPAHLDVHGGETLQQQRDERVQHLQHGRLRGRDLPTLQTLVQELGHTHTHTH